MKKNRKLTRNEKLLLLVALATTCTAGYFGYKYGLSKTVKELLNKNDLLEHRLDNLQEAASEGLYEEAIATVTRKINHVKDQIEYCGNRLLSNKNDFQTEAALNAYKEKLIVLLKRKNNFIEAQKTYELIVS